MLIKTLLLMLVTMAIPTPGWAETCQALPPPAEYKRSDVYKNVPFKAGEESKFSLDYGAAPVGYGYLRIKKPILEDITLGIQNGKAVTKKYWHMQFQGEAYTGDWYSAIFRGRDTIQAFVRPWNFAVSRFYIHQDEKATLSSPVKIDKNLVFHQQICKVVESIQDQSNKKAKTKQHFLQFGAADVLGAIQKLRVYQYQAAKPVSYLVYSSEKNWHIEATSVAVEKVTTEAGTFVADKLKLVTFIGKDMQAKGDSFVWIAKDHPNRPLVKVEAEVKFGSVALSLDRFTPGR